MTVHRRSIPASFALALYEYLDQQGVNSDELLALPRPPQDALLNADIPIDDWCQLLECASRHLDDPLARFHHYQRLIYDVTPLIIRNEEGALELVWDAEHGCPGPLVDETAVTALVSVCRRLTSQDLLPQRVDFINATPANLKVYTDPYGWWWSGTPYQTTIESTRYRRSGKLRSAAGSCEKRGLTGRICGQSSRFFAAIGHRKGR